MRVDICVTRQLGHRGCIHRSGECYPGKRFTLYFFPKDKNSLTHRRISKYNSDQDIWTDTTESSEVRKGERPKLSSGKQGTDLGHNGGRGILLQGPPTYTWGGKA